MPPSILFEILYGNRTRTYITLTELGLQFSFEIFHVDVAGFRTETYDLLQFSFEIFRLFWFFRFF
ncbi:MAG: hypothetical protein RXQ97_07130 [Caldivirga sp.]